MKSGDAVAWREAGRHSRPLGGNLHMVGSPEQTVGDFVRLRRAGIGGVQYTFLDVASELACFGEAVLPLMKQAGPRSGIS